MQLLAAERGEDNVWTAVDQSQDVVRHPCRSCRLRALLVLGTQRPQEPTHRQTAKPLDAPRAGGGSTLPKNQSCGQSPNRVLPVARRFPELIPDAAVVVAVRNLPLRGGYLAIRSPFWCRAANCAYGLPSIVGDTRPKRW